MKLKNTIFGVEIPDDCIIVIDFNSVNENNVNIGLIKVLKNGISFVCDGFEIERSNISKEDIKSIQNNIYKILSTVEAFE